jgi:hypothetical protein
MKEVQKLTGLSYNEVQKIRDSIENKIKRTKNFKTTIRMG